MANKLSSLDPKIIFDSFAGRIKTDFDYNSVIFEDEGQLTVEGKKIEWSGQCIVTDKNHDQQTYNLNISIPCQEIQRGEKTQIYAKSSYMLKYGDESRVHFNLLKILPDGTIQFVSSSRAQEYRDKHGETPKEGYTEQNQKKDDEYLKKIIENNHSKINELLQTKLQGENIRGHLKLGEIQSLLEGVEKLKGFNDKKRKDFRFSLDDDGNLVAWHKLAIIKGDEFTLGAFKVPKLAYIVGPDGKANKAAILSERGSSEKDAYKKFSPDLLLGSIDKNASDHKITPNKLILKRCVDCISLPEDLDWHTFSLKAAQILHNKFHSKEKSWRDLKPANFLWNSDDQTLRAIDFGNVDGVYCGTQRYTVMDINYHIRKNHKSLDILALIITISQFRNNEKIRKVKSPRLKELLILGEKSKSFYTSISYDKYDKLEEENKKIFRKIKGENYTAENILSLLLIDEVNTKLDLSGEDLISDEDLSSDKVKAITALYQAGFEVEGEHNHNIYRSILNNDQKAKAISALYDVGIADNAKIKSLLDDSNKVKAINILEDLEIADRDNIEGLLGDSEDDEAKVKAINAIEEEDREIKKAKMICVCIGVDDYDLINAKEAKAINILKDLGIADNSKIEDVLGGYGLTKLFDDGADADADAKVKAINILKDLEIADKANIQGLLGDDDKATQILQTKQLQDLLKGASDRVDVGTKKRALLGAMVNYTTELSNICCSSTTTTSYKESAFAALKMHRHLHTKLYNLTVGYFFDKKKLSTSHNELEDSGLETSMRSI